MMILNKIDTLKMLSANVHNKTNTNKTSKQLTCKIFDDDDDDDDTGNVITMSFL